MDKATPALSDLIDLADETKNVPDTPAPLLARAIKGRLKHGDSRLERRRIRYKAAMQRACNEKDLQQIMQMAVEQAKSGDKDARKCVLEYLIGKPMPIQEERGKEFDFQEVLFHHNNPFRHTANTLAPSEESEDGECSEEDS